MIRMKVRVDDEQHGSLIQFADLRHQLLRLRSKLRVDDQNAIATYLHGSIAAGARHQVHSALHVLDLHLDLIEVRGLGQHRTGERQPDPQRLLQ